MTGIDIQGLSKSFGRTSALADVTLEVRQGELLALLGPSGSGKTTLLRVIAGLEHPERGRLILGGEDALDLPPRRRGIGFVFQHYALFRHMTVADNIAFGLAVRPASMRPGHAAIAGRVRDLLSLMQLDGIGDRFPTQLSGGQRQRVALARALAVEPRVLLLDEPFGALDAKVRVELRHWLRGLHDRLGLTTLFVTHDQEEALELADRVAIFNAGRVEQVGAPRDVYDNPASGFVMEFLGEVNRVRCRVKNGRAMLPLCGMQVAAPGIADGDAFAYFRPHEVELDRAGNSHGPAEVRTMSVIGPRTRIHLDCCGEVIEIDADRARADALDLRSGQRVGFRIDMVRVFPLR
jgi:sulfate/thiosulfate transport system ATP-binding protein